MLANMILFVCGALLTVFVILCIAMWKWVPADSALKWLLKIFPMNGREVSFEYISLWPFSVKHFIYTSYSINISVAAIALDTSAFPYVHLEIHDMCMSMDPLLLQPIFDPSEKDIAKGKTSPLQPSPPSFLVTKGMQLAEYFRCSIRNIDVSLHVVGSRSSPPVDVSLLADMLRISMRSSASTHQIIASIEFTAPHVHVDHPIGNAMQYNTQSFSVDASLDIRTSLIDGAVTMSDKVHITMHLPAFLSFFNLYQTCEDNSIELKLMHGVPLTGKMRSMSVAMQEVLINASDSRSSEKLLMLLRRMKVQLNNTIRSYDEFDKCISVSLESFAVLGYLLRVHTISVEIRKSVNMISHIDSENMDVAVETVNMAHVDNALLDWLIILQHTADVLPSSRFNHFKNGVMHVTVSSLLVGFTNEICKHKLECVNHIAVEISNMIVDKSSRHDSLDSHFAMRVADFGVDVELPLSQLSNFYSVTTVEVPNSTAHFQTRSTYHIYMKDLKTNFVIMEVGFALQSLSMDKILVTEPLFAAAVLPYLQDDTAASLHQQVLRVLNMEMKVGSSADNSNPDNKRVLIRRMDASLSGVCVLKVLMAIDNIKQFQVYISSTMDRIKCPAEIKSLPVPELESDLVLVFSELNVDYHIGLQRMMRVALTSLQYSSLHRKYTGEQPIDSRDDNDDCRITVCGISALAIETCGIYINGVTARQFMHLESVSHSETQNFTASRKIVSSHSEIKMDDMTINLSPDMLVGQFTDTMLLHKDAIKKAMQHPNAPKSSPPPPEPTKSQFDLSRCQIKFYCASPLPQRSSSSTSLDGSAKHDSGKEIVDCFAVMIMCSCRCTVDNPNNDLNSVIGKLDDASKQRKYRYAGAMGGAVDCTINEVSLVFSQLKDPLVSSHMQLKGSLYLCAISDAKRVGQKISQILLWSERSHDLPVHCEVSASEAPSKVYGDIVIDCSAMQCIFTPQSSECISVLLSQLDHILPPSDEPLPLMWWDSVNYWLHGKMMLRCRDLQFHMQQQGRLPTPIRISLAAQLMELLVCQTLNLRFEHLVTSVRYAPNAMLGSRRSKYLRSSSSSGYPDNRNVTSNLCDIGHIEIAAAVTSCVSGRWNHHDVYHSARSVIAVKSNDRFHGFRILKNTLTWDVNMTCSDPSEASSTVDNSAGWVALFLRLDILDRLKESFSSHNKEIESPRDEADAEMEEENNNLIISGGTDVPAASSTPPLTDIMQSVVALSMKVLMSRLMVCSWMNQRTTTGFVFCQETLDVTFEMRNTIAVSSELQVQESGFSLQSLNSDISKVDVYVRDWAVNEEECQCVSDMRTLFKAFNKLMHTSRISLKVSHSSAECGSSEALYSLIITDMRLLWTISMRNILYIYFHRFNDLFSAASQADNNPTSTRPVSEDARSERVKSKRLSKSKMNLLLDNKVDNEAVSNAIASSPDAGGGIPVTEEDMELLQLLTRKGGGGSDRLPRKSHRRGARRMSVKDMNISDEDSALGSRPRAFSEDHALPGYSAGAAAVSPGLPKKSKSHVFFTIQLLSPQINFLDEKGGTSLLIVVSGESSVTGKHHNEALITKKNLSNPMRKSDVRLRMEGVSAFTVNAINPSCVANGGTEEESCLVYWKALASTFQENTGGAVYDSDNSYLKVAITDFLIQSLYTYYDDVVEGSALLLKPSKLVTDDLTTVFMLDLPELVLAVTSAQFYGVLGVVRNVLLAPPPVVSKRAEEDVEQLSLPRESLHPLDLNYRACRNEIRSLIEDNLHNVLSMLTETTGGSAAYYVEYFVGRGVWHLLDEASVLLEIGFMGLYGTHFFHEDRSVQIIVYLFMSRRCSTTVFEVQRFWVRNSSLHAPLDPIGLTNTTESSTPKNAAKSTVVAALSRSANDYRSSQRMESPTEPPKETWILMPQLHKRDACRRCGKVFAIRENAADSCRFHADSEGVPGKYSLKEVRNEEGVTSLIRCWSCCQDESAASPGCCLRPHVCKELMLSIRAEAKPTVSIDDVDMTILQAIEISVFPGALYEIEIFITRFFADVIHKYFAVEDYTLAEEQKDQLPTADGASGEMSIGEYTGVPSPDRTGISKNQSSPMPAIKKTRSLINKQSSNDSIHSSPPQTRHVPVYAGDSSAALTGATGSQIANARKEGIYVKYIRVGEINVGVSTVGFPINLDNYKAVVEPFVLHSKVLDWPMLLWKLEKHATWSVTKHTASNSMTKLYHFVFGKTTNTVVEDEDNEDDKVVMLLGVRRNSAK